MKCFYHKSDLDGHCSGAIVKMMYPDCEMIGVDYRDTIESLGAGIRPGETIFIVDFSFSVEDMEMLLETCTVIWIDHHKTAIEKMGHFDDIAGLREIGKAGCELTWKYLFPDHPMPETVRLLGRYDVWEHEDDDVLPFQYGMRDFADTRPEVFDIVWQQLIGLGDHNQEVFDSILYTGETLLNYQIKQDVRYAKGMHYEAEFEGYRAIVMNKAYSNSKVFDSVYDPKRHDIMVLFGVKPGEFKYSIFCNKPEIDVSAIAKKYGGGGHAGAAGFYSTKQVV